MQRNVEDQNLKTYIDRIFDKYDTDRSGTLDQDEMTFFFNDLFKQLNIGTTVTKYQSLQAIKSIDTNSDGTVDKKQLFQAFRVMFNGMPPQNSMPQRYMPVQQPYSNPYQPVYHNPYGMHNPYIQPQQQYIPPPQYTNSYQQLPPPPHHQSYPYTNPYPQHHNNNINGYYGTGPYHGNPYGQGYNPYNQGGMGRSMGNGWGKKQ